MVEEEATDPGCSGQEDTFHLAAVLLRNTTASLFDFTAIGLRHYYIDVLCIDQRNFLRMDAAMLQVFFPKFN